LKTSEASGATAAVLVAGSGNFQVDSFDAVGVCVSELVAVHAAEMM
jgi:hypothetical protein